MLRAVSQSPDGKRLVAGGQEVLSIMNMEQLTPEGGEVEIEFNILQRTLMNSNKGSKATKVRALLHTFLLHALLHIHMRTYSMLMHTHVRVHTHLHTCMHTWRAAARGTEAAARHKVTTKPLGQWHVDVSSFWADEKRKTHGKSTLSRRSIFDLRRLRSGVFWLVECRSQVGDNVKKSAPHNSTCDAVGRRNKIGTARPLTVPKHRQRSSCDTPSRKGNALNLRRPFLYEKAKQAVF